MVACISPVRRAFRERPARDNVPALSRDVTRGLGPLRTVRLLTTAALIVAALSAGATPAQAASPKPVTMTFAASPQSVERGAVVTLAGRAAHGRSGNAAPVDI